MSTTAPQEPAHAEPSARARELVRGGYDTHVHIAPDVIGRRIDDVSLARRFAELDVRGVVLKSHYTSTAERAAVVRGVVPEVETLGAITLNAAVGGLNPLAVEIAAREGARTVWLPTFDAENERALAGDFGGTPPLWYRLQQELAERGLETEPVAVVDAHGEPLPELRAVVKTIASHQLVLATGHLSRDEIFTVVDLARAEGVETIVVTHPEYPAQDIGVEDQIALAERGALLERCFTTPHTGKVSWQRMTDTIRATGPEHSVIATDLGQPKNPPVEDGMALFADQLLAAGFSEDEVTTMTVTNSRRVAGAKALAR